MGLHAGELVVAGPREEDIVMPDHAEERRPPHPTLTSAEEIPAASTPQGLCSVALGGGGHGDGGGGGNPRRPRRAPRSPAGRAIRERSGVWS